MELKEPYGSAYINGYRVVFEPYEFKKGKQKGKIRVYYRHRSGYRKAVLQNWKDIKPLENGYEMLLKNLLAIIHRDGGHYTEEHGINKSVDDAKKIVTKFIHEEEYGW